MSDVAGQVSIPDTTAVARLRPGSITLARHGEPALSRRCRLSSDEYRAWWARYEEGGLRPDQKPPAHFLEAARKAGVVLCSTRPRAIETAGYIGDGREVAQHEMLIEAPLPPPRWPAFVRLSPRNWGVISRLWWWFFGHTEGQESRREAKIRAIQAARLLADEAERGVDVLVVAHGFFNTMIGLELQRQGWRLVHDKGFKYWSTRRFERLQT